MMQHFVVPNLLSHQNANRASLVDVAYEAIAESIFDRRIEPGARLRIDALAGELGMSITPIREALARTSTAGLTRLDTNRGYTVTPVLDADGFHRLFVARRAIESAAVRGEERSPAAWVRHLTPDQLRRIRTQLGRMAKVEHGSRYADYSRFSRLDHELHLRVIELGGNPFLVTAFQSLNFHLHMSRLYAGSGVIDYEEAHAEHAAIVDALESGDGPAAWRACRNHMQGAERRLRVLLH